MKKTPEKKPKGLWISYLEHSSLILAAKQTSKKGKDSSDEEEKQLSDSSRDRKSDSYLNFRVAITKEVQIAISIAILITITIEFASSKVHKER